MRTIGTIGLLALTGGLAVGLTACESSSDGDVLARVGEERITVDEFDQFVESLPAQWKARARTPSGRKQILEHRIRARLIGLEAEDRGIPEDPGVRYQLEQARQRILLQALMQEWQKEFDVSEEELRSYYEEHEDEYSQPAQYRAQHILFQVANGAPSERVEAARAKAEQARARVLDGDTFDVVAREMSDGPTAKKGGDLGYVEQGRFHEDFEEAALALEPGEISEPVRTPFGWHVIKLVGVKDETTIPFEEVRDQIRRKVMPRQRQEAFEAFMSNLKEKHSVELDEDALVNYVPESSGGKIGETRGVDRVIPPDTVTAP